MARRKKRWIIIGVSCGVLIGLLVAAKMCAGNRKKSTPVEYIVPQRRTIIQTITANGRIQPEKVVKISPEVSGEIIELPVIEGQRVKKGNLLCRIKPDSYVSIKEQTAASMQAAKAQAAQANANYLQQKMNFERMQKLFNDSAISSADFERAQTELKIAENQLRGARYSVANAEASLREADQNLSKTTIYAPHDATISLLSVELGERVVGTAQMAGTELMRLANLERMEAWVEVSESDIIGVHLADTAIVHVDSYPDTTFRGVVTHIANTAIGTTSKDQVTSFEVRIRLLPESYGYLVKGVGESPFKPGMSVSVDIQSQTVHNALAVPIECVTMWREKDKEKDAKKQRQEVVFAAYGDTAKMLAVRTGVQDKQYIQIVDGITDSTRVISSPYSAISKTLSNGDKINATLAQEKNEE